MDYVCLYNTETKEILGIEEYDNKKDAIHRWEMFECEARARGGAWNPYIGEIPFVFAKIPEKVQK